MANLNDLVKLGNQIKNVANAIIGIALPVGTGLVLCDVLLDTKFGVLTRVMDTLGKIGIEGNVLMILIMVGLWIKYGAKIPAPPGA